LDKIKKDYVDHSEKVLNKFVTIIGGIVEHGLAPRIATTDFDARARDLPLNDSPKVECCVFLDGISSSTRKMHQVLSALLPPDHLQDVFSRIFAYVDTKVPTLFINAAAVNSNTSDGSSSFQFPKSDKGKLRLISEVEYTMKALNKLPGALPWDFTAMNVLARKLDYQLPQKAVPPPPELLEEETKEPTDNLKDENTSYKPTQSAEDKEYRNESNEQESPVEEEVTPVENGNS
jgi:vacuolar protein sorting-associated protein 54